MKKMLLLCSVALVLLTASVASAKSSPYKNLITAANWSNAPAASAYKNLQAAASWSRFAKPLSGLITKGARFSRVQDPLDSLEDDEMFGSPGPRTYKNCVKTCVKSALGPTDSLCVTNCTGCVLVGGTWSCAICLSCAATGFAYIELCVLHCCVDPGCPATQMMESAW